jgi:hypothetical protein
MPVFSCIPVFKVDVSISRIKLLELPLLELSVAEFTASSERVIASSASEAVTEFTGWKYDAMPGPLWANVLFLEAILCLK